MKAFRIPVLLIAGAVFVLGSGPRADSEIPWLPKKESIEVRLIALAVAYPKSSFFSNDEVFVAEQELAQRESRFIKLVYDYLPYQNPLSSRMNYSLLYRFHAVRDTTCDENLWEMRSLQDHQKRSGRASSPWKYAAYTPIADLDYRQARLRCYRTTSDDYESALNAPTNQIPY